VSRHGHVRGDEADAGELTSESEYIAKVTDSLIQISLDRLDQHQMIFQVKKARLNEARWAFRGTVDFSIPLFSHFGELQLDDHHRAAARVQRDRAYLEQTGG